VNEKPKIRLADHVQAPTAPTMEAAALSTPSDRVQVDAASAASYRRASAAPRSRSVLREELIASFAGVLFMDPADVDETKSFGELGMDSVLAVEWIRDLNTNYGLGLEAMEIYDHPTLRDMTALVHDRLRGAASGTAEVPAAPAAADPEPAVATNAAASGPDKTLDTLRRELVTSFASVLFMDPVEVDERRSFGELGMDSVLAVEWIRDINQAYGIRI
jgi:acyl carrier protein